jgi:hypothetical protein
MGIIPFTQYLLPDGRKKYTEIERPDAICEMAESITDMGFSFECEILTTGQASLTISGKDGDEDIIICSNEPGKVSESVDKLVSRFFIKTNPSGGTE